MTAPSLPVRLCLCLAVSLCSVSLLSTDSIRAQGTRADWSRQHTPTELGRWMQQHFVGKSRVSSRKALAAARSLGWLRTGDELRLFKAQYRALMSQQGTGRVYRGAVSGSPLRATQLPAGAGGYGPMATINEQEYNGSTGFSNDVGPLTPVVTTIKGSLAARDMDSFRFVMPAEGVIKVGLLSTGTPPRYIITSEDGDELWGMVNENTGTFDMDLPKGTYHFVLYSFTNAGSYTLNLSAQFVTRPTLALGKTNSYKLKTDRLELFKLVLPSDGRIRLTLASTGGTDTYLYLLNQSWRYIYEVDDDSASTTGDAGLNAMLPAGTYYVYVIPDADTTTSITATHTPGSIPLLATSMSGNIPGGEEDFDLYRVVMAKTETLQMSIVGNGSNPIQDSYIQVFDRNMAQALDADEQNAGNSSLSKFSAVFPGGIFYAASTGFYDLGGYTISKSTTTGSTTAARAGTTPGNITTMDTAQTFAFSVRTPTGCTLEIVENTLLDAELFVLDAKTGLAMGWADESFGARTCGFGRVLPVGDYLLIVKDWDGGTGTFDANIEAPLAQVGASPSVVLRGGEGNLMVFLASGSALPTGVPVLPSLIDGLLLVGLGGSLTFPVTLPTGGVVDLKASLPKGVYLQAVEFDLTTLKGRFTNRIE